MEKVLKAIIKEIKVKAWGRKREEVMTARYPCSPVSYTHLRAHETLSDLVCRLLLEKKKK